LPKKSIAAPEVVTDNDLRGCVVPTLFKKFTSDPEAVKLLDVPSESTVDPKAMDPDAVRVTSFLRVT
jgi:hypothetical protein